MKSHHQPLFGVAPHPANPSILKILVQTKDMAAESSAKNNAPAVRRLYNLAKLITEWKNAQ